MYILEYGLPYLPFLITATVLVLLLAFTHWIAIGRNKQLGNEVLFPRQIILMVLTIIMIVVDILMLPISESTRSNLLGLMGLLASAIIAFSSSTIVANLMAGLLIRVTKPFKIGDYIQVGEHFGRVSERGVFDTEIQSDNRELIAIPNTFLIRNSVTTTLSSGAIISINLSLGYDLSHSIVEKLLLKAAKDNGLDEPFVHVVELGDFSVTYRVSGFLTDTKKLLTSRSNLYRNVLDILHHENIEIMSPNYMAQRPVDAKAKVIPPISRNNRTKKNTQKPVSVNAEDIVFDKAEKAEQYENDKKQLKKDKDVLEGALNSAPHEQKEALKAQLDEVNTQFKALKDTKLEDQEAK